MAIPLYHIDSFTDAPFGGNPAAVALLDAHAPEAWMQALAADLNLSETAFVVPEAGGYGLRWFTPAVEVDLCGHATLAAAHALWEHGTGAHEQELRFRTRSGWLSARQDGAWIWLDFPARPQHAADPPAGLLEALGARATYVGCLERDYLIEVGSEAQVRALRPDFVRLRALPVRELIVTARADTPGHDFVSRFFAPAYGIDEDPVTGGAHCRLSPYWAAKLGRAALTGYQVSARGGLVRTKLAGERVRLGSQAVTIARGEVLCLP